MLDSNTIRNELPGAIEYIKGLQRTIESKRTDETTEAEKKESLLRTCEDIRSGYAEMEELLEKTQGADESLTEEQKNTLSETYFDLSELAKGVSEKMTSF